VLSGYLEIAPEALGKSDLDSMKVTLAKVNASDDQRANAWTLRRTMDAMFLKLSK
jgi:hypothetical protein